MNNEYIEIEQSLRLNGKVELIGAKNAVLAIMASLILTSGRSILKRVPASSDVYQMIKLLKSLGASVEFNEDKNLLNVDTSNLSSTKIPDEVMSKMRASVLVMGPLLARFGKSEISLPGGCLIGARPIDFHLNAFKKMGAQVEFKDNTVLAYSNGKMGSSKIVLEYPSVGATENIIMAACLSLGKTTIVNAAIEPEVLDFISVINKMGGNISILPCNTIEVIGVKILLPVEHEIIYDRLEAGSLLLAAAITKGSISIPDAPAWALEVFLEKLKEMGHTIKVGDNGVGIELYACDNPKAVSFKTMPYPGYPTDLQAQTMAALCLANGSSNVYETVFENRLLHVRELQKMGAQIAVKGDNTAIVKGVDKLYGTHVIATDIRAACALVLMGLVAEEKTKVTGVHHLKRGYQGFITKLQSLGAKIKLVN